MILVPVVIGGLGFFCLIWKRDLLGVFIGVQLLFLSTSTVFVLSGVLSGQVAKAYVFALFIIYCGVAQLVIGLALTSRFFKQNKGIGMDSLRSLKG